MSMDKLLVFSAAFILALVLGSMPVGAQVPGCQDNPTNDPNFDPTADCDNDTIPNNQDTCDNVAEPILCADDDGDSVVNLEDECPNTDTAALEQDLVIDSCTVTGVVDTVSAIGCSLSDQITECADAATNHGKFVRCVAHLTNDLKKAKVISGKQKGKIQSCAARSDIGKPSQP